VECGLEEGVLGLDRPEDELRVEVLLLAPEIVHVRHPIHNLLRVLLVLLLGRLCSEKKNRNIDNIKRKDKSNHVNKLNATLAAYDVVLVALVVLPGDERLVGRVQVLLQLLDLLVTQHLPVCHNVLQRQKLAE
jgi:hypothetical protein